MRQTMPMLTPLPSLGAGAPASPKGEPNATPTSSAQAAGGESREGNSTNTQPSTWTRLFQSLLTKNLNSDGPTAPGGSAPARKKAKEGDRDAKLADPNAPVLQAPVAAVPVAQPLDTSAKEQASTAPQVIIKPVAAITPAPVETVAPTIPGPTAPVAQPVIPQPTPEAAAIAVPQTNTTIQPSAVKLVEAAVQTVASLPEAAPATLPPAQATQPAQQPPAQQFSIQQASVQQISVTPQAAVVERSFAPASAAPAPVIESFMAPVEQALPQTGLKPAANNAAPAANAAKGQAQTAVAQGSKGFVEPSATASVVNRLADLATMSQAPTEAKPSGAASMISAISQIAQDDRTPGLVSAAQETRQGGRAPILETAALPSQPAPTMPSTPSAAPAQTQTQPTGDLKSQVRENAATGQNSVKTAANSPVQTQPTVVTTTAAPAPAVNIANTPLVQGSSQTERIGVINQIANQVASANPASSSSSTINVQVHPAHWGPLNVSITTTPAQDDAAGSDAKSVVAATIISADPAVRDVLKAHVQDLSNALTSAGFRVDKLEVAAQATTAASSSQNSSAFHQGQNNGGSGSGWLPNPSGFSAQTGDNRQNQSFSAAFGQSQGGNQDGQNSATQQISMQQEGDDQAAPAALMMRRSLVDYRI